MKDENKNMEELVQVVNKQLVTSSIVVAKHFEKRHDHVVRHIESVLRGLPQNGNTPASQASLFRASEMSEWLAGMGLIFPVSDFR